MISVSAGNYSNFVAAQFFNFQDPFYESQFGAQSFKPTAFWKERSFGVKKWHQPRAVFVETSDNIHFEQPVLDNESISSITEGLWDGNIQHPQESLSQAQVTKELVDLNVKKTSPSKWTDILGKRIAVENIAVVPNYSTNPELPGILSFSQGCEIWKNLEEQIENQIRRYAEEVDYLNGFQVLVDEDSGYSGTSSSISSFLSDEYEKKLQIAFGIVPPISPLYDEKLSKNRLYNYRMTNIMMLWSQLNSSASVFSTLSLSKNIFATTLEPAVLKPFNLKSSSVYETSCIIAAAVNNVLSPTISSGASPSSLLEFVGILNGYGRKLSLLSNAFPFSFPYKTSFFLDYLQNNGISCLQSLSLNTEKTIEISLATGNYVSVSGLPEDGIISESQRKQLPRSVILNSGADCLLHFMQEECSRSVNIVKESGPSLTVPLISNDESIFNIPSINEYCIRNRYFEGVTKARDFMALSCAQNSTEAGQLLDDLLRVSSGKRSFSSRITQPPNKDDIGVELDDFREHTNALNTLRQNYDPY